MPVAIQQSPEKCCTNLVHYSFLHQKSAKKQVVSGEKSPSWDGLQMTGKHRCRMAVLPYPAYKVMLPSSLVRLRHQASYHSPSISSLPKQAKSSTATQTIKRCSTAQTLPGAESYARGHLLRDAAQCTHRSLHW
ncbi:hypothetical protein FXN82_22935 [Citrobacter portucalensis]|nr:hypothetical protein FXN82_22935 [Citrobacter portucalensis]